MHTSNQKSLCWPRSLYNLQSQCNTKTHITSGKPKLKPWIFTSKFVQVNFFLNCSFHKNINATLVWIFNKDCSTNIVPMLVPQLSKTYSQVISIIKSKLAKIWNQPTLVFNGWCISGWWVTYWLGRSSNSLLH